MDLELQEALRFWRRDGDPSSAASLCSALNRAGLLPDSPSIGALPVRCDLDALGNATAHISIDGVNLLLFHQTVVGVQYPGQAAVINPEWNSVTTRKRIREWPFARHTKDLPDDVSFDSLIRFKPV